MKQPTCEEEWLTGSLSVVSNIARVSRHVYITLGWAPNQRFNVQLSSRDVLNTGCYGDILIWEPERTQ